MSADRTKSGPPDFPFEPGDRVAVRVLAVAGEAWFAGTVTALGSGGLQIVGGGTDELRLWVPWELAVVRDLAPGEWEGQE
jgi:hypothetical protein